MQPAAASPPPAAALWCAADRAQKPASARFPPRAVFPTAPVPPAPWPIFPTSQAQEPGDLRRAARIGARGGRRRDGDRRSAAFRVGHSLARIPFTSLCELRRGLLITGLGRFELLSQAAFLFRILADQPFPFAGILDGVQTRPRRINHHAGGKP